MEDKALAHRMGHLAAKIEDHQEDLRPVSKCLPLPVRVRMYLLLLFVTLIVDLEDVY